MKKISLCLIFLFFPFSMFGGFMFLEAQSTNSSTTNSADSLSWEEQEQKMIFIITNRDDMADEPNLLEPVITNYSPRDIETSLRGLDSSDTNKYDPGFEEKKIEEAVPIIKKPIEGWGNLKLGLTFDEVVTVLSNDYPWMVLRPYDEEENSERVFFLESFKNDFFTRVQFQFDKNRQLYLLRLEMNPRYFSFAKTYDRLFKLYGLPQENSYIRVTWKDATRSLELHRNYKVVYIDKKGWDKILPKSLIEDQREKLLNSIFDNL